LLSFYRFRAIHNISLNKSLKNSNLQEIAFQLGLESGSEQRIETSFTIEKDGMLTNLEAFSEYPELKEEALKILKKIEKLQPQEHSGGKFITQEISLPIKFKVETEESRLYRLRKDARKKELQEN